jgi:hypothetical protein
MAGDEKLSHYCLLGRQRSDLQAASQKSCALMFLKDPNIPPRFRFAEVKLASVHVHQKTAQSSSFTSHVKIRHPITRICEAFQRSNTRLERSLQFKVLMMQASKRFWDSGRFLKLAQGIS